MTQQKISLALAGSTQYSLLIAQTLKADERFELVWVLTPQPKKVGRKQELTKNPLHSWAEQEGIEVFLVEERIAESLESKLVGSQHSKHNQYSGPGQHSELSQHSASNSPPDYLLVVDFGYLIPSWLLKHPTRATLNLHPSALPAWRGSSPGQFVILAGEKHSAISLIKLTEQLDAGPILAQTKFAVQPDWTSQDYYRHSFQLAGQKIADWIAAHFQGELKEQPQPSLSPTPLARKITKDDAFLPWGILEQLMHDSVTTALHIKPEELLHQMTDNSILRQFLQDAPVERWPETVERACRAFQPWPVLWTNLPTQSGEKRVQLVECQLDSVTKTLSLEKVKIEGKSTARWNEVKNSAVF